MNVEQIYEAMMYASAIAAQQTVMANEMTAASAFFQEQLAASNARAALLEEQLGAKPPTCNCVKCFLTFCSMGRSPSETRATCEFACARQTTSDYKDEWDRARTKVIEVVSSMTYPEDEKERIIAFLAPSRVEPLPERYVYDHEYCLQLEAQYNTWENKLKWGLAKLSLPEITADMIRAVLASKGHIAGLASKPAKKTAKPKQGGGK